MKNIINVTIRQYGGGFEILPDPIMLLLMTETSLQ